MRLLSEVCSGGFNRPLLDLQPVLREQSFETLAREPGTPHSVGRRVYRVLDRRAEIRPFQSAAVEERTLQIAPREIGPCQVALREETLSEGAFDKGRLGHFQFVERAEAEVARAERGVETEPATESEVDTPHLAPFEYHVPHTGLLGSSQHHPARFEPTVRKVAIGEVRLREIALPEDAPLELPVRQRFRPADFV